MTIHRNFTAAALALGVLAAPIAALAQAPTYQPPPLPPRRLAQRSDR